MIRFANVPATAPFLILLVIAALGLNGCSLVSKAPDLSEVTRAANPMNWFGGGEDEDKEEAEDAEEEEEGSADEVKLRPASASIGMVHMVDSRNGFLLIRSSREAVIEYGSQLISLGSDGMQTAELKLSPERKGAFLVADIIKGNPGVGDVVKLVGASDLSGGGVIPLDSGEVQVLE